MMPKRCCVPGCRSNYDSSIKTEGTVSTFKFPNDKEQRQRWTRAIPRTGWTPSASAVVCTKHFQEFDVVKTIKGPGDNGEVIDKPKLRPELVKGAVPCIFANVAPLSKPPDQSRPSRSESCVRIAERHEQNVKSFLSKNKIADYGDFISHFEEHNNKEWIHCVKDNNKKQQRSDRSTSEHGEDDESSTEEDGDKCENISTCTSDTQSQNGKLRLSSDVLIPESTKVTLEQELLIDLHELSEKIQNFYPVLAGRQFTLCFKGEDGDKCEYIFTSASDTRRKGERHSGSRCDECKANIIGSRYKCVTCADYDLCSACEALGIHDQHDMMRIAKPLKSKQARAMLRRCCNAMKAGVLSATVNKIARNTSSVDPINSSVDKIVEASMSKAAPPNKSKTTHKRRSTKQSVKSVGPSKAKAPTTTSRADDKQKNRKKDRKRKAEASEDEEEERQTVKEEPDDSDLASNYNSFTNAEPFVAMEEVKLEYLDPLETEQTIKVEQPTSAGPSSWSADNYTEPAAAAGSGGTSRPQEDTASVCPTYTQKRVKHESDLNS